MARSVSSPDVKTGAAPTLTQGRGCGRFIHMAGPAVEKTWEMARKSARPEAAPPEAANLLFTSASSRTTSAEVPPVLGIPSSRCRLDQRAWRLDR